MSWIRAPYAIHIQPSYIATRIALCTNSIAGNIFDMFLSVSVDISQPINANW